MREGRADVACPTYISSLVKEAKQPLLAPTLPEMVCVSGKTVQRRSLLCTALDIMVVRMFLQRDVFGSGFGAFYGAVVNFQNVLDDSVVPPVFLARTCQ